MSVTNALLIRAAYGWDGADDSDSQSTYGRREALYGLGSYNSRGDVARTAAARFAISASPRYQFDAVHTPANDEQVAYHGYTVGDRLPVTSPAPGGMTEERVVSVSISENRDDGRALVTTTLNDVVLYASPVANFIALLSNAVKKMIPGAGRGAWVEAQPVTPPAQIVSAAAAIDPGCGAPITLVSGGGGTGTISTGTTPLALSPVTGIWCHVMVAAVWPTDTSPSWHGTMSGGGATWVDEGGVAAPIVLPRMVTFGFVGYAPGGLSGTPTFDLGGVPIEDVEIAWVIACLDGVDLVTVPWAPFGRVQSDQFGASNFDVPPSASCGGSDVFPTISPCDAMVGATFSSGNPVGSPASSPPGAIYSTQTTAHGVLSGLFDAHAPALSPVVCTPDTGDLAYAYAINVRSVGNPAP